MTERWFAEGDIVSPRFFTVPLLTQQTQWNAYGTRVRLNQYSNKHLVIFVQVTESVSAGKCRSRGDEYGLLDFFERGMVEIPLHGDTIGCELKQEPVIYVAGRPHVLRLVDKPLENVEYGYLSFASGRKLIRYCRATGVTTAMVETMEERFKNDVLRELRLGGGCILLHDELEERPGVFKIIPIWETVSEEDILTPRDVFDLVANEGYKVRSCMTGFMFQLTEFINRSIMTVWQL